MGKCPFCSSSKTENRFDHMFCPDCNTSYFYSGSKLWYHKGEELDEYHPSMSLDRVC